MDQYSTFLQANAIHCFSVPFQEGGVFSSMIDSAQCLAESKGYTLVDLNKVPLQLKQDSHENIS